MNTPIILVVGADGQLARALLQAANATTHSELSIAAIGRPALDITKPETLTAAMAQYQPALVVNCAGYTGVDQAETEDGRAFAVNAEGAAVLAEKCHLGGIPMIHISTDFVFSGTLERAYVETDATGPANAYGLSKLEGEKRVAAICQRHVILRTSWVYSPLGSNFVRAMLRLAGEREEISVVADQQGCPTYAPHLAAAILEIASQVLSRRNAELPWGIYHAAGSGETSWCGFAQQIFSESARRGGPTAHIVPIATEQYPTPASRPANSRLDCTKLKAYFGIELPHWKDGTAQCVAHLLSSQSE
ncbi:MAG: dTDP-4-dehydrorhamnose reductase [Hyphomicrobiales bacterium]|nr:dTDP-4-dehydrorhamnose reductase [Hyphomicrobiales bacterium]